MANDDLLYEYAVVRYVPRVDREEFVNIGLLMMCKRRKWLRGEIMLNRDRIRALYPHADLDMLSSKASLFMRDDVPFRDIPVEERYRWLTAVKSAVLQVSPSHPGVIIQAERDKDSEGGAYSGLLEREFQRLFRDLIL